MMIKTDKDIRSTISCDIWRCPQCDFIVTNIQMQGLKLNLGCPRCQTSLDKFIDCPIDEQEGE